MEQHLFAKGIYINRRKRLVEKMDGKGIILFPGNDESGMNYKDNQYPFRQDSSFLYFFGLDIPGLTAMVDLESGEEIIFGTEWTVDDMIWTGPMPSLKDLAAMAGVEKINSLIALEQIAKKAIQSSRTIHLLPQYRGENIIKLVKLLDTNVEKLSSFISPQLVKAVISLREIKEDVEIKEMEKAITISTDMHFRAMEFTRTGMKEFEVGAQIETVAKSRNARFAYPLIFTVNGEILHNHGQSNTIEAGKLILCDTGAENEMHYAGDLTRTFPASKKFNGKQKDIHEIVLSSMDHATSLLKPGICYKDVHKAAAEKIVDGLKELKLMKGDTAEAVETGAHALFLPHGLGHMLGLDVHDMEALGEDNVGYSDSVKRSDIFGWKSLRLGKELKAGFVLTVEPGIYFIPGLIDQWSAQKLHDSFINYDKLVSYRDFGGIRVEDNYLITANSSRKLGKHLPRSVAEIESLRSD